MIDSHSHIYCDAFDDDREAVVERAVAAGVTHIVLPNENLASVARVMETRDRWPQLMSPAIGLHPEEVKDDWADILEQLQPLVGECGAVAVGEVGIDLYWDTTYRQQQLDALHEQLRWCVYRGLPFILHSRHALDDCLTVLRRFGAGDRPPGVFHCFEGDAMAAREVLDAGDFVLGVGGSFTFKRNDVTREMVAAVGLENIVLETDSPYLAPVPHRGKRNESAFMADVAQAVANHLGTDLATVERVTTANARRLFGL